MTAAPRGMHPRRSRLRLDSEPDGTLVLRDRRSGAAVATTRRLGPGAVALSLIDRPPLKASEDALLDTVGALFAEATDLQEVELTLEPRDGWVLPAAQALGFSLNHPGDFPASNQAGLRITRLVWQDVERGA